ncbi:MAG: alanine/glycine:cation symporter family protein [Planctomycetota bacterium]
MPNPTTNVTARHDAALHAHGLTAITVALLWLLVSSGSALAQDAAEPATSEPSAWQTTQIAIEETFEKVNEKLIPVLFVDASFGLFDPELESVEADLVEARAKLVAAEVAHATTPDPRGLRLARKTVETLEAQQALLVAKPLAAAELAAIEPTLDADRDALEAAGDTAALEAFDANLKQLRRAANANVYSLPLIVVFLLFGGVFFTLRFGFINLRLFAHSMAVVRGRYDNPKDHGEVSHFQALTAALSATVGLGNIAGVAIAISMGGAGAVFWMWFVAFFGMSSKFSSCTLAQMYRKISDEKHGSQTREHVLGGPMLYLAQGMKDVFGKSIGTPLGKVLAVSFALFAIGGALGGGNLFQGNQTFAIVSDVVFAQPVDGEEALMLRIEDGDAAAAKELRELRVEATATKKQLKEKYDWVGGLIMAVLVGAVIIGGIRRIGEVTSKLVPAMCVFYVSVCGVIVLANFSEVPTLIRDIIAGAFSGEAMAWGGLMGVLVIGVKRGAFSNEAGLGSAAIAHSAAKTDEPVREGAVAMIGPFIDTIVVCTMTALAILITGAHLEGSAGNFTNEGVGITASAFSSLAPWLTVALMAAVFVFAYSTMISWSYYGERASEYLFGKHGIWPFRAVFLLFVFMSPLLSLDNVITFTDLLILSMAYPNILGMLFLSRKVAAAAKDYVRRLKSGEMKTYAQELADEEGEPSI